MPKYELATLDSIAKNLHASILLLAEMRRNETMQHRHRPALDLSAIQAKAIAKTVAKPVAKAPAKVVAKRPHGEKTQRIIAAITRKGGISPADLRAITVWPIGPVILNRMAAVHGFSWKLVGEGDKARYVGKA